MDPSYGTGTSPNEFNPNNNSNYSLNGSEIESSELSQSSQQQQAQAQVQQSQFQLSLPLNLDINSLSPAEREMLIRRLHHQQQQQQHFQLQQQQQLQRTRQAQAQNFQRMTMNAYATPRPPLNPSQQQPPNSTIPIPTQTFFINPIVNMSAAPAPMNMPIAYHHNFAINRPPPMPQNSINPSLLQSGGTFKPNPANNNMQQMSYINPQQFTNPLKSDPVLYSTNTANVSPAATSSVNTLNVPPFDEQTMSSEGNFVEHLIKFYDCIKFSNRVVPQIAQRSISLYRLFQVVISAGGFVAVGENRKWAFIAQTLRLPSNSYDVVATLRAIYYTFLYPYEQYFIQKKPLDKIDCNNKFYYY
jgi:hypothetical protein